MATFLLEIGTEELPADFARLSLEQLERRAGADLKEARLSFDSVHATSTPRRLALIVEGLAVQQSDRTEEIKGPPAAQAFRDGVATPAAIGFARRCGVDPERLEVRETGKGPFVFAHTLERGAPTAEVLTEMVPAWIWELQGRRFMRWGNGEGRFSRPIRWLVALLDADVVPLRLEECDPPLRSGRLSRGHRLQPDPVAIADATVYAPTLAAVDVQVERWSRAQWVRRQLDQAAAEADARLDLPDDLFEELVDLVESPELIEGTIEDRFLALPPEVLTTVMRAHQRYVPLLPGEATVDPLALTSRGTVLPRFLCIANGRADARTVIQRGNERVLRARLADAEFFLAADRAVASEARLEALGRVTFAEGLGSLKDRSDRIHWLADQLAARLPLPAEEAAAARRAAALCKHDLVSQMVGEFPELQGVMGAKYLLAEGEERAVALAVLEHYRPRGAGDALPQSPSGSVVAMAERLELLVSIFARGERPTGSSDPYALRRAGNGLLQILLDRRWPLPLTTLLDEATRRWQALFPDLTIQATKLSAELADFLRQRLEGLLAEMGFAADLVAAVAGEGLPLDRILDDLTDLLGRIKLLADLRREDRLAPLQAVVQRASRLAEHASLAPEVLGAAAVDPTLFTSPAETAVLGVLERSEPHATGTEPGRYASLALVLAESADTLAALFDGEQSVLVMCDDPKVRENRLTLLAVLRNQSKVLADFSRLSG